MQKKYKVYKYTAPNGKLYIGQTCNSLRRRAGNHGECYVECPLFYNAIKKYGFETTQFFGGWDGEGVSGGVEAFKGFDTVEIMVHPNYNADGMLVDVKDWANTDGPALKKMVELL